MSKDLYLAVGHGRRDNGVFDPGALGDDGRYEHYEATEVVAEAAEALRRSGVTFDHEDHGSGGPEDPNFSGTIRNVNAGDYRCAFEVHFDWSKAPEGGFGFWISNEGKKLADSVYRRWVNSDLPTRPEWHSERGNLAFLNRTQPPACLWECGRIRDFPRHENAMMGEAIAAGICDYLGKKYIGPSTGKRHYDVAVIGLGDIDEIISYQLGKRWAFKRFKSAAELNEASVGYLVKVGGAAAKKFSNRKGLDIVGRNRYETAEMVLAKITGRAPDRETPWS